MHGVVLMTNTSGHQHEWSPTRVVTNPSGHQPEWSPIQVVTNTSGRQHEWSPTRVVTNTSGDTDRVTIYEETIEYKARHTITLHTLKSVQYYQ